MPPSVQVGPYTVIALADGAGPFFSPRSEAFPGATTEQWAAADRLDPGALDAEGRWRLQFRAFAIRSDQGVTLVDAGIDPSDVDTVVVTHLHTVHVGWAVVGGERMRPFFPNAAYLLQQAEAEAIERINPQLWSTVIEPLRETDQPRLLDGDTPLRAGERVCATPGHTPGHQSVLVTSGPELVVVTGDLLVHAIQLLHPELAYAHEMNHEQARASREKVLRSRAAGTLHLATPHLTEPFVPRRPTRRGRPRP
ncbi:MBL fold metallo-hydrolase [Streptomyces anulatus]|uniref:MBL fold metallo-hydrolase n=1 Tax=Streptomyces anulatus TaxID=1892 RepID=UPI003869E687|nr:MBL fold metallo-hydrolase [Streptomyces anulatus]